jgi:hypothetical protein
MGVYRFYCKHEIELEFLVGVFASIIKRESAEVSLDYDQEHNLWCFTVTDLSTEGGPF